jgi:hypothetical protein
VHQKLLRPSQKNNGVKIRQDLRLGAKKKHQVDDDDRQKKFFTTDLKIVMRF